jgi:hypothetical protein
LAFKRGTRTSDLIMIFLSFCHSEERSDEESQIT